MLHKKAQGGILSFVFSLIIFIIIWALWLGSILSEWGARMIADNSLTGIQAFLAANLNLWLFLGLIISIAWAAYMGGGNQ